jgi:exopolysaccharide biosynthesis polyprenyl glycosylphosphotransferase
MTRLRNSTLLLLGLDFLAVFAVFNAVFALRELILRYQQHAGQLFADLGRAFTHLPEIFTQPSEPLTGSLFVPFVLVVVAIYLIDGYRSRTDMLSLEYTSQHIIALVVAAAATLLLIFVLISAQFGLQYSRGAVALSFVILTPLSLTYRRFVHLRAHAKDGERSVVFVGDRPSAFAFREEARRIGLAQPIIYTAVSDDSASPFGHTGPGILPFSEVLGQIQRGEIAVEAIVLRESGRELVPGVAEQLVKLYFGGVPTYTLELFHEVYWRKIPLYRLNQIWLFQEGFPIARMPVYERLKRLSDIVLASFGLILASPIIALTAVAVWLEDRGPVFFRQSRIGRNGTPFRIVKFRTMAVDSDQGDRYTRPGDPRITRIGKFLRTSRFDEIPQLWNVLRGEMSMIGPRAEWDKLVTGYEAEIPCYFFRHLVKPGITGWAQVNYPYGANLEDTRRKLEYDLYYIRHYSFRLDAAIVLKTIHIMLFGKGR